MASFVGAGNAQIDHSAGSERMDYKNYSGTNSKDSESMDSHDSDSDESFTCEYDSTWEDEVETSVATETSSKKKKDSWRFWSDRRNTNAAKDMQTYRHDYPGMEDPPPCQIFPHHPNLKFYKGEINSQPDDVSIEDFHEKWRQDYTSLERVHTFIQWLFPIREDGVNFQAYKLTKDEIKAFNEDEVAKQRLRESYELMLDFYGIKLVDHNTGEVQRAKNWEKQFNNLNKHTHNNLRITRILKCLGILGFKNYQAPLVRFFLKETLENGQLRNVRSSALDYFLFSVLDKEQRKELIKEAFVMFQKSQGDGRSRAKFVWCPKWVQKRFQEELNSEQTETNGSEQTETNRANQSLGSADETQPTTEGDPSEQNKQQEKEEGSSEDIMDRPDSDKVKEQPISSATLDSEPLSSKISDEDDETVGSKGDGEGHKNTQVASEGVEMLCDMNDQEQGQSANKPTEMATNGSSVSGCSIKPQLDSDNNSHGNQEVGSAGDSTNPPEKEEDNEQHCTSQGDCLVTMQDETSPDLTTVSQDKLKGSLAHGNLEVGPTGGPTDTGKAEEFKEDTEQENDTEAISIELDNTVREGSEGQGCKNE